MELGSLHDLGIDQGLTVDSGTCPGSTGITQAVQTPVAAFICPTRRKVMAYPLFMDDAGRFRQRAHLRHIVAGRSDYATSLGDAAFASRTPAPPAWMPATTPDYGRPGQTWAASIPARPATCTDGTPTGVCYRRSMVRLRDIKDGASNTYLAGERNVIPDAYIDGTDIGDYQSWDASFCFDNIRWSGT